MRFLSPAVMAILVTWSLALPAAAQDAPQITVIGEGLVETAPDMATITLGVQTEAPEASDALRANSERVAAVLEWLRASGIAAEDTQTTGLSLSPVYASARSSDYERPEISGFMASNMVTIRVRDLEALGGVMDAVVQNGANAFNGLGFGLQTPEPTLDEARRRAVADARRKAELYAEAAGVTLGPILSISEQSNFSGPQPMMREAAFASDSSVPVAAGQISVNASVTIVYGIAAD